MTDRLLVLLSGTVIGVLERDDVIDPTFTYLPEHVAQGETALSARLPLRSGQHPAARVRPYLAGLLPESMDVRRAWGAQLGIDAADALGILAQMGWDCPGAVQFCREQDLTEMQSRTEQFEPASLDAIVLARL